MIKSCLIAGFICLFVFVPESRTRAQSESSATLSGSSISPARGLPRIGVGTLAENPEQARWNAVVLLAQPRLSSGDVSSIPRMFRDVASSFVLTILATIEPYTEPASGEPRYRLAELGCGFSMDVGGKLTVVTSQDYDRLGVKLGIIQQQVLSRNEKQLNLARLVARTSTLTMFDVPAIMLRNGKHEDFVVRHFIWIDARTGQNSALVWLLKQDSLQRLSVVDEPIQLLRSGTKEDRRIHVDASQFVLGGIPTERSFALEALPPGAAVAWTDGAKQLAAQTIYDAQSMLALTNALNEALQDFSRSSRADSKQTR